MIDIPPGKYFISHSYKDAEVRDEMIKKLPDGVEPFIFPPISVSPQDFVSNALIEAILDCDGVIVLEGGFSSKSFWVAFERDYAVRSGKRVYSYRNAPAPSFSAHNNGPLDLQVVYTYTDLDNHSTQKIWDHMSSERHFTTSFQGIGLPGGDYYQSNIETNWVGLVRDGALAVIFISDQGGWSQTDSWEHKEIEILVQAELQDRIIFAFLSACDLPPGFEQHPKHLQVQLWGDNKLSATNRIDDLIVRLYWLIFRNQFPDLVYD